jgi:chromosome segregation ATPase
MMKHDGFKKLRSGIGALRTKGGFILYLMVVIILLGGGVTLGYYIWGVKKHHTPDYTKYLRDTIVYLQKLEESKSILAARTKSLTTDVAILKKSLAETKDRLTATKKELEEKLSRVEKENRALKKSLAEKDAAIAEGRAVKKKYEALLNDYESLKAQLSSEAKQAPPLKKTVESPQAPDNTVSAPRSEVPQEESAVQDQTESKVQTATGE